MGVDTGIEGVARATGAGKTGAVSADAATAVQEATARMFRSVRAGRDWLRTAAKETAASLPAACVRMKPGNDEPPLFMIPGAPGSVFQLGPLAAALPLPTTVYAIKPRGLDDGLAPCATIAEMAEYAIGVVRAVRPEGPYLLMGYSAGGLVALEMAKRLSEAGHEVPAVVLLDTYPGKPHLPLLCHAEILVHLARGALRELVRCNPAEVWREAVRRTRSLFGYLAASGVKFLPPPPVVPEGWSEASRRVYAATFDAGEAYRPVLYAGKVIFVRPEKVENLTPPSPMRAWRRFLGDFEVRKVPGSHLNVVEANAALTAAVIGEHLKQVLRSHAATRGNADPRRPATTPAAGTIEPRMGCPSCP